MKKFIIIFICFFFITIPTKAIELTGGVSCNVDEARDYVFEDIPKFQISGNYTFKRSDNVEKIVYSYDNEHQIVGITVLYKNELNKAYIYDENKKLIYVDIYDKNVNLYPHRGYRYNLQGKLILTSLSISKNEHFRFDAAGNLIAHSINNVIYDENGNVIGTAK